MSATQYKDILEMFSGNFPLLTKMYTVYDKAVAMVDANETLSKSIEVTALEALELIVVAARQSQSQKKETLKAISTKLDTVRVYVDLAAQTSKLTPAQAQEIQEAISGVGRMVGGWMKKINNPQA
ncbi:four helix bundle protein [Candidatus Falkowbacteria bacterium]|nr:four helix bundle protein [Candidatus Falkowbacteria bacterium]